MDDFNLIEKNILYEDNHLLAVYKECGILSQPDSTREKDLFNLVKNYIKIKYKKPGNVYLGLLHRLDLQVSGITLFAKTSKSAKRVSEMFQSRDVKKFYNALVEGSVNPEESHLIDTIKKDEKNREAFASEDGMKAELYYKTMRKGKSGSDTVTLLEIELYTGRFHQIRFQLSSRGFPVLGDKKYGSKTGPINRCICLHASKIILNHPVTKESVTIISPYPKKWNKYLS
jgi:23S rRNA pseudouridine1911/1915/1917 synthase